ncbi:MAG: hypothetical protein UY12_C0038G0007 [Parcubacteria group bacterium GW2011_GWA2_47_8b]|nr:MAG: hypothetical protein UY12_C0038G0007 [Parcubacteria group bacterium GW2011_GWA2_47_8b]
MAKQKSGALLSLFQCSQEHWNRENETFRSYGWNFLQINNKNTPTQVGVLYICYLRDSFDDQDPARTAHWWAGNIFILNAQFTFFDEFVK